MIIAIDVGNTNIVIGSIENGVIESSARISTNRSGTAYELAMAVSSALEFDRVDPAQAEGAIISSVVPNVTETLKLALAIMGIKKILTVGSGLKTGLNIRIDDPAQLGSDMVVGAVAALDMVKPPMLIIDMGTATTISAIDRDGAFRGGAIIPGVGLSLNALAGGASLLPKVSIEAPPHAIGTNTVDCMQSGAVLGAACMIDGLLEKMEEELGSPCSVVATGGLSVVVIPLCRRKDIILEPDLLLKGLSVIWDKNVKK